MENDLRLKISEYFKLSLEDRDNLIKDLTDFYFDKNVSTRTLQEFDTSINQLIFWLEMEYKFALKTEAYNRVEIYQKLSRIFHLIKEKADQIEEE
jgi:hypothetical protein